MHALTRYYLLMPETEPMYARDGLDEELALESVRSVRSECEAGRGQLPASVIGMVVDVGLLREASAERSSHCAHRRLPGMRMHIWPCPCPPWAALGLAEGAPPTRSNARREPGRKLIGLTPRRFPASSQATR